MIMILTALILYLISLFSLTAFYEKKGITSSLVSIVFLVVPVINTALLIYIIYKERASVWASLKK